MMKMKEVSETLLKKSIVEDSVINGARCEQQREDDLETSRGKNIL